MKFFKKQQNVEVDDPRALTIPKTDGTPGLTIPGNVIDSLRYVITRAGKKEPFPTCLSVVSSLRGEGVTTISQALGAIIAHDLMARVCVVDLNWWWPSESALYPKDRPGLAEVALGAVAIKDVITATGWPNLSWVPAGEMPQQNRPVVARNPVLKSVISDLKQLFDYIILDVPAISATNDAIHLAALGDACCLVVRHGVTNVEDVRAALDEVEHLKVIGVIMNRFKMATPPALARLVLSR